MGKGDLLVPERDECAVLSDPRDETLPLGTLLKLSLRKQCTARRPDGTPACRLGGGMKGGGGGGIGRGARTREERI